MIIDTTEYNFNQLLNMPYSWILCPKAQVSLKGMIYLESLQLNLSGG